jgi:two-component system chemotaxis response regulator CheB/chemosensory pili system protein ChpB (putative protein-glutamate methylesterase)
MSERLDDTLAAEVPAGSGGAAAALPRTALLYADEALLAHVEQTLAAMRVPVVYRAAIEQADHGALVGARPEIALINLDDRCGDKLDDVTAALDAAGVPIVFNDADISNGLEGWARARWARHLCAKLCGKDDVDPPRPEQPAASQAVAAAPVAPPAEASIPFAAVSPVGAAEIAPQEIAGAEPASASRPLSQGEIDALVADFPSETPAVAEDTEAWSAQIDELLANAPASASNEPAPWDVTFVEEEPQQAVAAPAPTSATAAAKPAAAPARVQPAVPPSADQWQLVDDFTPVVAAPKEKATEQQSRFDMSKLDLELEPLEPVAPPTVVRESFAEMRLDDDAKAGDHA